ncbi:hypothetical protein GLYMA_15G013700v4 [Glycine max]|uniref:Uncharacterized protein n=1 Tax=Glycine max TaxID=3847 RepID=K7M8Y0_SOYBN|nr:hypothetical protein GYH30_041012 [Glycine max]KRH09833.1 hypothetical protein GLYMA_15G013700v4 [Glycine max]
MIMRNINLMMVFYFIIVSLMFFNLKCRSSQGYMKRFFGLVVCFLVLWICSALNFVILLVV